MRPFEAAERIVDPTTGFPLPYLTARFREDQEAPQRLPQAEVVEIVPQEAAARSADWEAEESLTLFLVKIKVLYYLF